MNFPMPSTRPSMRLTDATALALLLDLCNDDPETLLDQIERYLIDSPIDARIRTMLDFLDFSDSDIDALTDRFIPE